MVEQKVGNIALHARSELRQVLELASAVGERGIADGEAAHERREDDEHLLSLLDGKPLVSLVAVQQRLGMERDVGQAVFGQAHLVAVDLAHDTVRLVVEHERDEIVARPAAAVSAFVHEYAELFSHGLLIGLDKKTPGDFPRHLEVAETATEIYIPDYR